MTNPKRFLHVIVFAALFSTAGRVDAQIVSLKREGQTWNYEVQNRFSEKIVIQYLLLDFTNNQYPVTTKFKVDDFKVPPGFEGTQDGIIWTNVYLNDVGIVQPGNVLGGFSFSSAGPGFLGHFYLSLQIGDDRFEDFTGRIEMPVPISNGDDPHITAVPKPSACAAGRNGPRCSRGNQTETSRKVLSTDTSSSK